MKYLSALILILFMILSPASQLSAQQVDVDKYKPLTRSSMSMLYWRFSDMDISSDYEIDHFIMINKCDLYKESYNDDFAWHEIRQKARASLLKNKDTFNNYIKVTLPIGLGRYNIATNSFPLTEPISTNFFEIQALDEEKWPCRDYANNKAIWKYPHDAILSLPYAVRLYDIAVPANIAEEYNNLHEQNYERSISRPAYLTLMFKVFEADNMNNKYNYNDTSTIDAILEKIEIHGDRKFSMLIYSLDTRQRKQDQDNNTDIEAPTSPQDE